MGLSCFHTFLLLQELKGENLFKKAFSYQQSVKRLFSQTEN